MVQAIKVVDRPIQINAPLFIRGGGEVGESRRTVNPFLFGEWVRLPPSPPEVLAISLII